MVSLVLQMTPMVGDGRKGKREGGTLAQTADSPAKMNATQFSKQLLVFDESNLPP